MDEAGDVGDMDADGAFVAAGFFAVGEGVIEIAGVDGVDGDGSEGGEVFTGDIGGGDIGGHFFEGRGVFFGDVEFFDDGVEVGGDVSGCGHACCDADLWSSVGACFGEHIGADPVSFVGGIGEGILVVVEDDEEVGEFASQGVEEPLLVALGEAADDGLVFAVEPFDDFADGSASVGGIGDADFDGISGEDAIECGGWDEDILLAAASADEAAALEVDLDGAGDIVLAWADPFEFIAGGSGDFVVFAEVVDGLVEEFGLGIGEEFVDLGAAQSAGGGVLDGVEDIALDIFQ